MLRTYSEILSKIYMKDFTAVILKKQNLEENILYLEAQTYTHLRYLNSGTTHGNTKTFKEKS